MYNAKDAYKTLPNIEARALIYQKILLESEIVEKLKFLKILKESFENDGLANAFDVELKTFLKGIKPTEIPKDCFIETFISGCMFKLGVNFFPISIF